MSPRILMLVTASLLAATIVIGTGLSFKTNNAIAQMMQPGMMGPGMMAGNMTSGMMQPGMMGMAPGMMAGNQSMMTQMMGAGQNITISINLMNIIGQAIGSKVNVSLSDAATTAEASIGNNSHAVAAHIDKQNGYLVYNVMVLNPNMNISKVIVDPGNGQVLFSKQLSKEEHMMMHGMMGPGMMMGGPQQGMGMMMGPGAMNQGMMGPGAGAGMMGPEQGMGMMGPGMFGPSQGPGLGQRAMGPG